MNGNRTVFLIGNSGNVLKLLVLNTSHPRLVQQNRIPLDKRQSIKIDERDALKDTTDLGDSPRFEISCSGGKPILPSHATYAAPTLRVLALLYVLLA